jgi:hypothetical protein
MAWLWGIVMKEDLTVAMTRGVQSQTFGSSVASSSVVFRDAVQRELRRVWWSPEVYATSVSGGSDPHKTFGPLTAEKVGSPPARFGVFPKATFRITASPISHRSTNLSA